MSNPKPCKYCGFIGSRLSDEDCPENPESKISLFEKIPPLARAELLSLVKDYAAATWAWATSSERSVFGSYEGREVNTKLAKEAKDKALTLYAEITAALLNS